MFQYGAFHQKAWQVLPQSCNCQCIHQTLTTKKDLGLHCKRRLLRQAHVDLITKEGGNLIHLKHFAECSTKLRIQQARQIIKISVLLFQIFQNIDGGASRFLLQQEEVASHDGLSKIEDERLQSAERIFGHVYGGKCVLCVWVHVVCVSVLFCLGCKGKEHGEVRTDEASSSGSLVNLSALHRCLALLHAPTGEGTSLPSAHPIPSAGAYAYSVAGMVNARMGFVPVHLRLVGEVVR